MSAPQPETPPRIAVISSSVREGRFGPWVGAWVHKTLIEEGVDTELITLSDLDIPRAMTAHPHVESFGRSVGAADAVLIVTPEYNHSFPGTLKIAIDSLRQEWQAKPVGFVSYGGMAGGLRAVEALRLVFAELHAVTVRETVSLHNPWGPAQDPGVDYPEPQTADALHKMLRQLLWWASALSHARARTPYPA
jgi:NAD(P)H-dependent FMN reductase